MNYLCIIQDIDMSNFNDIYALCFKYVQTKTEIRNIRKDCMDMIKKLKKGSVSEDDTRKLSKEVNK